MDANPTDEPVIRTTASEDIDVKYRVIHLIANPVTEDIERHNNDMKRLIEENSRLKTRLELLETGCEADITRRVDEGMRSSEEFETLRQRLIASEKRQQKIIDAFRKTSNEFREVCYRLTGYRIDLLKHNTYRLSHIYADSPEEVLLFACDTDRTLKLLENQYSQRLSDSVETYLAQHDSFPAFLASLTLDLFRRQTIVE